MKTDKLLHFLQQKKFMRSGGALPLPKAQWLNSQVLSQPGPTQAKANFINENDAVGRANQNVGNILNQIMSKKRNQPFVNFIDTRTNDAIVPGKKLEATRKHDVKGVSREELDKMVNQARKLKVDPSTLITTALWETNMGQTDRNLVHDLYQVSPTEEGLEGFDAQANMAAQAINRQLKLGKKKYPQGPFYKQMQAFQGYGNLYPNTEEDYYGHANQAFFGIPVTKQNPLRTSVVFPYGKTIENFRDSVVRPTLDQYGIKYKEKGGSLPKAEEGLQYAVKPGDSLSKISKSTGVSLRRLIQENNIKNPNLIHVNQVLNLPSLQNTEPPQSYQEWSALQERINKLNALQDNDQFSGDEQRINQYYSNRPDETYLVVDKKKARMNLYKGNELLTSYEAGTGQNPGDAQTVTKITNGNVDWTAGNKSTGAGIYTISRIDPASRHYYNLPSFNLKNERGIEVATTIHGTPLSRRYRFDNDNVSDNRMSNGCINGKCYDLKDLYTKIDPGSKVFILPEDPGNSIQIVDGKPVLRVDPKNRPKYNTYVDQKGITHKGQGVNQTINTLQYKPIKAFIDKKSFQNDIYQTMDLTDDEEYNTTTLPYISALVENKKKIMELAQIPSDVYNEIAKMSFGIYGAESNFGDDNSPDYNLLAAANKVDYSKTLGNLFQGKLKLETRDDVGGPDVKAKATTYGANQKNQSVGYTQIRWAQLNADEKAALAKLGIKSNMDFLDPKKAAMATTVILGIRYNQQLTVTQKKDLWKHLPSKWNSRANYADRVRNNSKYVTFKQLDNKLKEGGELTSQKAAEMLYDGTANGKPLTAKQERYFKYIANKK